VSNICKAKISLIVKLYCVLVFVYCVVKNLKVKNRLPGKAPSMCGITTLETGLENAE
jgi:hypothetical protein